MMLVFLVWRFLLEVGRDDLGQRIIIAVQAPRQGVEEEAAWAWRCHEVRHGRCPSLLAQAEIEGAWWHLIA
jgi:hypothetical protein